MLSTTKQHIVSSLVSNLRKTITRNKMNYSGKLTKQMSKCSISMLVLVLGWAITAQAEIENITVECGNNKCFILCQPNIQSAEDLTAYVEQAHNRLAQADPLLQLDVVVTFKNPIAFNDIDQFANGLTAIGISVRSFSVINGESIIEYPYSEDELDSTLTSDSSSIAVSMKLTSDVTVLNELTLNNNVLCVDAGAIELLEQYDNAMIIVLEDLYD